MTIRSKQWYTKTSRLSNSFANSSIGRLPDPDSATRSSAGRPVESNRRLRACVRKGKKGVQGKETVGFVPLGLRPKLPRRTELCSRPRPSPTTLQELARECSRLQNFKYFWLGFKAISVSGRSSRGGWHSDTVTAPSWRCIDSSNEWNSGATDGSRQILVWHLYLTLRSRKFAPEWPTH